MARSYKKTAGGGNASGHSEKFDKRQWHKRMRSIELQKLSPQKETEEQILPIVKEVSDPWLMNKDGKGIYPFENQLRKGLDNIISNLLNGIDYEYNYRDYTIYVREYFFEYFKTDNMETALTITDEQKELFIQYILKKYKRK